MSAQRTRRRSPSHSSPPPSNADSRTRRTWLFLLALPLLSLCVPNARAQAQECPLLASVLVDARATVTAQCCGQAGQPCASLQTALSMVQPRAQVLLSPGVYRVPANGLNLGARILSVGPAPAATGTPRGTVVIDCAQGPCLSATCAAGGAIPCPTASLSLQGITVRGGNSPWDGGCLRVSNMAVTVGNSTFQQCTAAGNGGAVSVASATSAAFQGVIVDTSTANAAQTPELNYPPTNGTSGGGAISLTGVKSAMLTDVHMSQCSAPEGAGGCLLVVSSVVSVQSSSMSGGEAYFGGGCVSTYVSTASLANVTLTNCKAAWGGCLGDTYSTVTVHNSTLEQGVANNSLVAGQNVDQPLGGGLGLYFSVSATVSDSVVQDCYALGPGAGIAVQLHKAFLLSGSTVHRCYTDQQGAGVDIENGPGNFTDSHIVDNTLSSFSPNGGGVYIAISNTSITRCNISGNNINDQRNPQSSLQLTQGGGIFVTGAPDMSTVVTVADTLISGNTGLKGAGLFADTSAPLVLSNCTFTNNSASSTATDGGIGGAVALGYTATFSQCQFLRNSAVEFGGAVYSSAAAAIDFSESTFEGNVVLSGSGGAVYLDQADPSATSFSNSSFLNNRAPQGLAGAIMMYGTALNISSSSRFANNSAAFMGGAVAVIGTIQPPPSAGTGTSGTPAAATNASFTSTAFEGNSASLGGGALYVAIGASVSLENCNLTDNRGDNGGAILVVDSSTASLTGTTCQRNNATLAGGCIAALDSSVVTVSKSSLESNSATDQGGAIKLSGEASLVMNSGSNVSKNTASGGGAIWAELFSTTSISGSSFSDNQALFYGGALYFIHSATATLSASQLTDNLAPLGGAVLAEDSSVLNSLASNFSGNTQHALALRGMGSLTLHGGLFAKNMETNLNGTGGAIWVSESGLASLSSATFDSNSATRGGAVSSALNGSVTVSACVFSSNNATDIGGGGYAEDVSLLSLANCTFFRNFAGESGGGAAFVDWAHGGVAGSKFFNNSVGKFGAGIFLLRGPTGPEALALVANNPQILTEPPYTPSSTSPAPKGSPTSLQGPTIAKASRAAAAVPSGILGIFQALNVTGADFSGSHGAGGQGTAFFDGSFLPQARANCTGCQGAKPVDSIGGLPDYAVLQWQSSMVSTRDDAAPLVVLADIPTPIDGLTVTLYDSEGKVASSGYDAIVEVQSDVRVSGFLRDTPLNGVAVIPEITLVPGADTSSNFTLLVTVSSPSGSFPRFSHDLEVSFCPNGTFLNSSTFECDECAIGSWCEMGQGSQFCSSSTYTFFPGESSVDSCVACPSTTDAGHNTVLTCGAGSATLEPGWWMDTSNLTNTPSVFLCDISAGCVGMSYSDPSTPQCGTEYGSGVLCAGCAPGYYALINTCYSCSSTTSSLFPLWAVLLVLCWLATAIVSSSYHSISLAALEIQVVAVLGSLALQYPTWVLTIVEICSISLYDPSITGIGCHFDMSFETQWFFTVVVCLLGVAFFSLGYVLLWISSAASRAGKDEVARLSADANPPENKAVRGLINWLDLCYLPICIRVMQALHQTDYSVITALSFSPSIEWGSSPSKLLFGVAIVLLLGYIALWPVLFISILVYAKTHKMLNAKRLRTCLGGMLTRYESGYFWWHGVLFVRRVYYACIFVFLHDQPGLQMMLLVPAQVLRLGLEFAASPFTSGSHDLLCSSITIAEILFTISITGLNYLSGVDALVTFGLIVAVMLFCGPIALTFPYEVVNKYVDICKRCAVKKLWKRTRNGDYTFSAYEGGQGPIATSIDPKIIANWFRPHIICQVLLPADREHERELLLRVCCAYERVLKGAMDEKGAATSGAGIAGTLLWTKGLKKSQLFAALHQVVLGATVGEKVMAEVPLKSAEVNAWAQELMDSGLQGKKVDLTASRSLARFRQSSMVGSKRAGASFRLSGSMRRMSSRGSSGRPAYPRNSSIASNQSGFSQQSGRSGDSDPLQVGAPGLPPLTEDPSPTPSKPTTPSGARHEITADDPSSSAPQSMAVGQAVAEFGNSKFIRSLSEDDDGAASSQDAAQSMARGRPLACSATMRLVDSKVRLVDEKPEELWPPPLENRATWVVKRKEDDDDDVVEGGEVGDRVEALLDSMGMSLAFQESFGQLTLVEKKNRAHALRRLLTSTHVNDILAWLSSPECTMEDRKLFVEFLSAVREAAEEEAGELQWWPCTKKVIFISGPRCGSPW